MARWPHDKTEKATPKRRTEARERGQVAKSTDVNAAAVLLAGLIALSFMGPSLVHGCAAAMHSIWGLISNPGQVSTAAGLHGIFNTVVHTLETTVAPICAICLVGGVLANVGQIGFHPSGTALKPDFKRLNPSAGIKNMFGSRALVELGKSLAKVCGRRRSRRDGPDPRDHRAPGQRRHHPRRARRACSARARCR